MTINTTRREIYGLDSNISRGFNGSANISENCDFRSQYDPFYIIV